MNGEAFNCNKSSWGLSQIMVGCINLTKKMATHLLSTGSVDLPLINDKPNQFICHLGKGYLCGFILFATRNL